MKCKIREDTEEVVGCIGATIPGANYCYSVDPSCWYPPIPTPAPVATPTTLAPSRNTMILLENCTEANPCKDLPTCAGKFDISLLHFFVDAPTLRRFWFFADDAQNP